LYNYKAGIKNAVGLTANADEIGRRARLLLEQIKNGYFKNMAKKYEAATANPILESNLLNH